VLGIFFEEVTRPQMPTRFGNPVISNSDAGFEREGSTISSHFLSEHRSLFNVSPFFFCAFKPPLIEVLGCFHKVLQNVCFSPILVFKVYNTPCNKTEAEITTISAL